MNKNLNATASATLSTSSYMAPTAELLGVTNEGVLCASTVGSTLSVNQWQDGEFSW